MKINNFIKLTILSFLLTIVSCNQSLNSEKTISYDEVKNVISSYDFNIQKLVVNSRIESKINSKSFTNDDLTIEEEVKIKTIQQVDLSSYSSYYVYSLTDEEHIYKGALNYTQNSKLEVLNYIKDDKLYSYQKLGENLDATSQVFNIDEDSFKEMLDPSIQTFEYENRLNYQTLDIFNNKSSEITYLFNDSNNELTIEIKKINLLDLPFSSLTSSLRSSIIIDEIILKYDQDGYIISFDVPIFKNESVIESLNIKTITEQTINQKIDYKNEFNRLKKL